VDYENNIEDYGYDYDNLVIKNCHVLGPKICELTRVSDVYTREKYPRIRAKGHVTEQVI